MTTVKEQYFSTILQAVTDPVSDAPGVSSLPIDIFKVESLCSRDACIVHMEVLLDGDVVVVSGTSRRYPGDKPDDRVAYLLAYSRAFESLTHKIAKRAKGLVRHNDNMRDQKPEQRIKSQAYHARIAGISSTDDRVQRRVIRDIRDQEGSWRAPDCV